MRFLFAAGCFLAAFATTAQNKSLLLNGGFELINKEPNTYDQIDNAEDWKSVTIGYAEVFSPEGSAKTIGIPDNDYGHMDPQEGTHYAGFCAWKDDVRNSNNGDPEDPFEPGWNVYSEYITAPLKQPLLADHTYHVVFHVALSGNSDRAISGLGAYFGPQELRYDHRHFLHESPQVGTDSIHAEKGKWITIEGTFVADGGERFITLGCFPAAGFYTKRLIEGPDNRYAYYYIDGILVEEVPAVKEEE